MKNLLLAGAAILAIGGTASAADLAVTAPLAPPVFSWGGCYVGVNGGWVEREYRFTLTPDGSYLNPITDPPPNRTAGGLPPQDIPLLTQSYQTKPTGSLYGGQVGCNWQGRQLDWFGGASFVGGFEVDFQGADLKDTATHNYGAFPSIFDPTSIYPARTEIVSTSMNWLATIRGRRGLAWDRLYVYGTTGVAIASFDTNTTVAFSTFPVLPVLNGTLHTGSDSSIDFGWVIGGGLEYAFGYNWSLKAEYLLIGDLSPDGPKSPLVAATLPASVGPGYSWRTAYDAEGYLQTVRVGLNYRFISY